MLSVTFRSEDGPGHCIWCDTDKDDCADVKFGDGSFDGLMCDRCFKRARKNRLRVAFAGKRSRERLSPEDASQIAGAVAKDGEGKKP